MKQIQSNTSKEKIGIILVGNKCDLEERQVSYEEGESLSKEFGILFYETSAYKDINVSECFEKLTSEIISRKEPDTSKPTNNNNNIDLSGDKNSKKKGKEGGCCK